jgi:hypothetical protein
LRTFKPGQARDEWLAEFFDKTYWKHDFKGDDALFNERCRLASQYVTMHDQAKADVQGYQEFWDDCSRKGPKFDPTLGKCVFRPFNLGQCRRTSGPSHVVAGGGVALEPTSLYCEKPLGPSRYTGVAIQRRPSHGPHEFFVSKQVPKDPVEFEKYLDEAEKEAMRSGPIYFPEEDRSSPVQCSGSRAESDRHNVDTGSEGLP